MLWDEPTVADHLHRLASFSRLITTDLLGVGSSDAVPIHDRPAMQSWTDGLVTVLDAVESERVSVFATSESALPVMLLAASYPHRVRSLVLWGAFARYVRAPDYPFGMPEQAFTRYVDAFGDTVGTGAVVDLLAPSWAGDAAKRRWWARGERLAGGPGYFKAIFDLYMRTDMRPVLESIQALTLLLHRRGDRHVPGGHPRYLAERIPHTRLIEPDGDDHEWFAGDAGRVLDEIESFLTGGRAARPTNRVLSTVLFTDIVGSTERAAMVGDEAWTTALGAHNRIVERHVASARGAVVSSPATARWRPSTALRVRSTARVRSETRCKSSAFPSARACTPGRWRWSTAMCTASRCTSPRALWRSRGPARSWCQARSHHWYLDRGSPSTTAAAAN